MANGFFAGAEIALVALRKTRLQELADERRPGARIALLLREKPERLFATVQVGITVVGATAAAFAGAAIAARLTPWLEQVPWVGRHGHDLALALVVALVSYLSIVVGELVPKSLALRGAERYALLVAPPLWVIAWLVRPLVWLLTASSNLLLRPVGDRTTFTEARISSEELQQMVEEATEAGTLHPQAGEIASRALDFADLSAAEVMVPRQDVVAIRAGAAEADVRRLFLEHAHRRYPVYQRTIDEAVGYVTARDVLARLWKGEPFDLPALVRPAHFVPETKPAADLLQEMRARRLTLALVVDESGGLAGLVTLEDLLEELVGEIFSEHPRHLPHSIQRQPDGSVLVRGGTPIREVNRALGLELPEGGDFTTVAGLVLSRSGRIPAAGERVDVEGGVTLEVAEASPRSVRAVRIHPPSTGEGFEQGEAI
ncbi:MAG TPA: hemolysin family protein [Anaeromyxobacteraceae bacterium]|nr:hemolysin family protein [Anaeromyxobacteraceae bacterium]